MAQNLYSGFEQGMWLFIIFTILFMFQISLINVTSTNFNVIVNSCVLSFLAILIFNKRFIGFIKNYLSFKMNRNISYTWIFMLHGLLFSIASFSYLQLNEDYKQKNLQFK